VTPKQFEKARKELGLSQPAMAKALGRSRQTIINLEKGTSPILRTTELAVQHLLQNPEKAKVKVKK